MREFRKHEGVNRLGAVAVVACEGCSNTHSLVPLEGTTWDEASTAVLAIAAIEGWYLGVESGDLCPECVEKAGGITLLIITTPKHDDNPARPHDLMFTHEMSDKTERERRTL
jgi:hypothetical protein